MRDSQEHDRRGGKEAGGEERWRRGEVAASAATPQGRTGQTPTRCALPRWCAPAVRRFFCLPAPGQSPITALDLQQPYPKVKKFEKTANKRASLVRARCEKISMMSATRSSTCHGQRRGGACSFGQACGARYAACGAVRTSTAAPPPPAASPAAPGPAPSCAAARQTARGSQTRCGTQRRGWRGSIAALKGAGHTLVPLVWACMQGGSPGARAAPADHTRRSSDALQECWSCHSLHYGSHALHDRPTTPSLNPPSPRTAPALRRAPVPAAPPLGPARKRWPARGAGDGRQSP